MASSSSNPPSQNTAQFTKLTESNYLVWLPQLKPYLHGAKLGGYIDGSIPERSATKTQPASEGKPATIIPNLKHETWFTTDQQIVSILTTSLSENVARLTIGFDTSKGIWDCLARHFSQKSVASATSLKLQLFDLQKGSQSVDEYLQQAKSIADSLASINQPVSDADLVVATLHGLGPDYLMLRTALAQSSSLPDFSNLLSRILAFEAQQTHSSDSNPASALFHHGSNPAAPHGLNQDAAAPPRGPSTRRDGCRPSYGGRNNQRYRRGGGARSPFPNFAFNPNANASFLSYFMVSSPSMVQWTSWSRPAKVF
ncbi:putative RNA-directed DNA polymerase [Rosa chinensis]|uniref:Putative RNA-directed DNA polymerase n=1 Tax=Rosa chinensis TaxID=74649 RepID=A0A2P6QC49_ROSCH|nr:putative RNA-directed DNA polymerase [Rosa chinensis]